MFCIQAASSNVYFNLATEEYLLKSCSENIFMLWQSNNAVVVGKHQNVDAEVNMDYAVKTGIHIARRFSGGGTVYQDMGNINLTFIENTDKINFNKYMQQVLEFLLSIGIKAQADERLGITVNGLKISGSAQCVHKNRVMYHCTLLYSTNLDILNLSLNGNEKSDILPGTKKVRAVKSVKSQVSNIHQNMQNSQNPDRFKELIMNFFLHKNPDNCLYDFSQNELINIENLKNEKYARSEWIYHRSMVIKT